MSERSRHPSDALPDAEEEQLDGVVGDVCTGITLCGMRDCEESFSGGSGEGFHELTWGVVFSFQREGQLAISWQQDPYGNPNRLAVVPAGELLAIDSVVPQDVSRIAPWSSRIGEQLGQITLYSYETNWAGEISADTWHQVAWGLEFFFPSGNLLVAAAIHGSSLKEPMVNDELVVAYTPEAIANLRALREGYREEWSPRQ